VTHEPKAPSFGSAVRDARLACLILSLTTCLALAFFVAPASATYLHANQPTHEFGPDGTDNFTKENSFYARTINSIAIDSQHHRLYVMSHRDPGSNGAIWPGAPHGLYGFDISDPNNPTPLGGDFPLAIPQQPSGYSWLTVDPGDGTIYMVEKAEQCFCDPGGTLYSWDLEGKPRPGFPVHIGKQGPMAVDLSGYLWVWHTQNNGGTDGKLKKFLPDGTFVEEFDPNLPPSVGSPRDLTFDRTTGDMWLEFSEAQVRFTADSGYTYHDPPISIPFLFEEGGFAFDSNNGIAYNTRASFYNGGVESHNSRGGPAEDFFGVGGLGEENYTPPPVGCGGFCPPEVPESKPLDMALDEATGDVYVADDGLAGRTLQDFDEQGGGHIRVYSGIGASDARTGTPAAVGKTDATLTASVGQGEGPAVTNCLFQYVDDASYGNVRIVSVPGATSGRFRFNEAQKWIPYNATAAQVEESWQFSPPTVTGPAGGPWRIETTGSELGRIQAKTEVRANELKPGSVKVSIDWDASTAPCQPSPTGDVHADISGLANGATYRYRVVASSAAGRVFGSIETLTTTPGKVQTGAATEVEPNSATLNGTADPENLTTTYYFEYGRTPAYGSTSSSPPGQDVGTTAPGDQPVSDPISGLEAGKTYHYRIVAVNTNGTSKGVDRTFVTTAAVQGVETLPATEVNRGDAMLHGKLDPDGAETHYYFEWGTSRRYGTTSATPPYTNLPDTSPGDKQVSFKATGLHAATTYHYRLVATSSLGTTFGGDQSFTTPTAVIGVSTDPASDEKTESAVLHGKLDPDGIPSSYYFQYGKTLSYGQTAPLPPGIDLADSSPGVQSVQYLLEGLEPGTTYHYRMVGANFSGSTVGNDQTFTTTEGPAIEGVTSDEVTASSANLLGKINPNGFATEWFFEYGLTQDYGTTVPVSVETLGPATTGQPVSVSLTGLENTTYHFRLVAESEWGTATSEDQTFEFKPPSCPNSALRQQTGANYLPDCRAYELVTPARAGGTRIYPSAPFSPLATNHLGFEAIFNAIPGTEPPNSGIGLPANDFYVASRTVSGWKTHYVGLKGDETLESQEIPWYTNTVGSQGAWGIPADQTLEHFLTWDGATQTTDFAPYMWDAEGKFLDRLPSNVEEVPGSTTKLPDRGGFVGDGVLSGDASTYAFSAINMAFLPDGVTKFPGSAYRDDIATGALEKISLDEAGQDIKVDPAAPPPGLWGEFIKFPLGSISTDGTHILMSVSGASEPCQSCGEEKLPTSHLYMNVAGAGTYDVSKDFEGINRSVHYGGTAAGGSQVFFTTPYPMTEDDEDTSVDLFRWDESTNALTRLSAGFGGTGNSNGCGGAWTSKCGVEVVPISMKNCYPYNYGVPCRDTPVARNSGDIYFYSPEQLDEGARGIAGQRNLYVYRNGAPRFVATMEGSRPAERINVSFDGDWMAFMTRSPITAYDNDEHLMMYRFNAQTRSIICVSCRVDGEPPTEDARGSVNGLFLTNDGRTFFTTPEAMVDRDTDGVASAYEYVDGRPQLISSGTEGEEGTEYEPIGLVGVTADGVNAFFATTQTLTPQDENGAFYKIYDARSQGGFPFEPPPAPCAAADECHGEGASVPAPPRIGSSADLGDRGNFSSQQKKHKKKRHKKHRKGHRKSHKHEQKGAGR
jgi:phosphodiesterase/alkaline phosphatase D-like protein